MRKRRTPRILSLRLYALLLLPIVLGYAYGFSQLIEALGNTSLKHVSFADIQRGALPNGWCEISGAGLQIPACCARETVMRSDSGSSQSSTDYYAALGSNLRDGKPRRIVAKVTNTTEGASCRTLLDFASAHPDATAAEVQRGLKGLQPFYPGPVQGMLEEGELSERQSVQRALSGQSGVKLAADWKILKLRAEPASIWDGLWKILSATLWLAILVTIYLFNRARRIMTG